VSFLGWWGLRAYSTATAGTKAVRLIRSSDSTQQDINTLANGNLNTSDAFFDGSTYKVVTLYDKTGNARDLTQATDANRPVFTLSGLNGLPIVSTSTSTGMDSGAGSLPNQSQPYSMSMTAGITAGLLNTVKIFDNAGFLSSMGFDPGGHNLMYIAASTTLQATASDAHFHAAQGLFNGVSSAIYIDGSNTTGDAGTNQFGDRFALNPLFDQPGAAEWVEMGFMTGDQSGHFSALNTNQTNYWGPF
jgi:hypothetical protein